MPKTAKQSRVSSIQASSALLSEEELVKHFQEHGDETSLIALLDRYQQRIRRFLYVLCGNADHTELQQEIISALWHSLARFSFRSALSTYVYRICRNIVYRYFRSKKRTDRETSFDEQNQLNSIAYAPQKSADDMLQQREHVLLVRRALQRLKMEDRLIIHLREFELYSVEQCADILSCRIGTVKSQLHRAKKRLARIIGGKEYETF